MCASALPYVWDVMLGTNARKLQDMSDEEFGRAVGDDSLVPDIKFKRNKAVATSRGELDHPEQWNKEYEMFVPSFRESMLRGVVPPELRGEPRNNDSWKLSEALSKLLGVVRRKPTLSKKLKKFMNTGDYK